MTATRRIILGGAAASLLAPMAMAQASAPQFVALGGAAGWPRHTLSAYRAAADAGADYLGVTLAATREGDLVCLGQIDLGDSTNVASLSRFANRSTPGRGAETFPAHEFLAAEIGAMRTTNGDEAPPTFRQAIDLARAEAARLSRPVGLWVMPLSPGEMRARGVDMAALLLDALNRAGLPSRQVPVMIASFERLVLERLRDRTHAPLIQATQNLNMISVAGVRSIAAHADGLAVDQALLTPQVAAEARRRNLTVQALRVGGAEAAERFTAMGVDVIVTEAFGAAARAPAG